MRIQFKTICFLASLLFLTSACYRGESKTLDGVLRGAKVAYDRVSKPQPQKAEVADALTKSLAAMEVLLRSTKAGSGELTQLINSLYVLIPHSNYTVRPAMTELAKQYQMFLKRSQSEADFADSKVAKAIIVDQEKVKQRPNDAIKLMVARTYRLFASELETSRFNLRS